jgi:mitogen-activated protein kinase 1/3
MAEPLPNWDLGPNYTLVKKLGAGSYGSVCQATDNRSGDTVAVKQVTGIFDDVVDAKRMLREISILRTMDHPNIIKIKDIIVPPNDANFNSVFIVMEAA